MSNAVKSIMNGTFSSNFESTSIAKNRLEFQSIQLNVSGDMNFDVEIRQSLDGINWATVKDSELTGQTEEEAPIIWDLNAGNPKFYKVVVTVNSGAGVVSIYSN